MARPKRASTSAAAVAAAAAATKIIYNEASEDNDSSDDKDAIVTTQPARKRQRGGQNDGSDEKSSNPSSPVARKQQAQEDEDEDDKDEIEPRGQEKESDDEPIQPKKKRGRPAKLTSSGKQEGRGPEENRTCPHCDKVCSTIYSMKYHVDHKVCRKAKPAANTAKAAAAPKKKTTPKKKKSKDEKESEKKIKPTIRRKRVSSLPVEDRTCPHCAKVYAAAYGLKYHIDHKVCLIATAKRKAADAKKHSKSNKDKSKARAARKGRSKVADDEEEEEDIENDNEESNSTNGQDKDVDDEASEDDDEEFNHGDDEEDDDFDEVPPKGAARRKKRVQQPKSELSQGNGMEETSSCPHCGKIYLSIHGLQCHLKTLVCHNAEVGPSTKGKKAPINRRGPGRSPKNTSIAPTEKRFRGGKAERTCPNCAKEFTSTIGREYHVRHRVCKRQKKESLVGVLAFQTLETGSKFVTSYGVVEVIADDRVTPTYKYPENIAEEIKKYTNLRDRQTGWKRRAQIACGFQSRLRRKRLARAYKFKNVNSDTTTTAYFGGSAIARESIAREVVVERPPLLQDPMCPPEACPDRIVVCKQIPDCRPTFYSLDQEKGFIRSIPCFTSNLYLRRQDLNKRYSTELSVYICSDCGRDFTSRDGYSYHIQSKVCFKRAKVRDSQRSEMNDASELRFERFVKRNYSKQLRKRKVELAVYPQVWLSLGFSVKDFKKNQEKKGDEIQVERRVQEVDETLQKFRELVQLASMKSNNEKLGAMYPQVFKALGFRKPSKRKRAAAVKISLRKRKSRKAARVDEADETKEEVQHEEEVPVPFHTQTPPQIMDMHVLIDEARSGRYPSIQRYTGDYPDECVICKKDGKLLLCDFCSNTVHLKCLLTRVTFKELDPEEDFLCHSCARKIVSRRNRAEKRRLQKQLVVLENARQKAANAAVDDTEQSDYHVAASVGKELSELLELLKDSRDRLHHMTEASRLNNFRRAQLLTDNV